MSETLTIPVNPADLPLQVRYTTLLKYMAFAPFAMGIVLVDQAFLGGLLKQVMDLGPEHMINLMAILTFPHIIASLISFADKDYYTYYRAPLIKGIAVSLA